jgi:acetyl/propionyl-CoA carboxylase alpha subunit
MLAKLIVHGSDRAVARRRLAVALDELLIGGLVTNTGFHRWLIDQPDVVAGCVTTRFLDHHALPEGDTLADAAQLAAAAWLGARREAREPGPWSALDGFRVTPHRPKRGVALLDRHEAVHEVEVTAPVGRAGSHLVFESEGVVRRVPAAVDLAARRVVVNLGGESHTFRALSRSEHWAPAAGSPAQGRAEDTRAPFPAVVTETPVAPGDPVAAGDVVIVIEAMKMLHSLTARGGGIVAVVHASVGESVESKQILVSYESQSPDERDSRGD